jgi:hypothetical protein
MYAVLITAQSEQSDYLRQHLVVALNNSDVRIWSRLTNGGRGATNSWNTSVSDVLTQFGNELIVGEILSSPLSPVDEIALNNNERPEILFQKLTKQFALRHKSISQRTVADVWNELETIIATDTNALSKYRSDGRVDKNATTTKLQPVVNTPVVPVQIVRTNTSNEVTSTTTIGNNVAFIPNLEIVSGYVPRQFHGVNEETIYDLALNNKINVLIEGEAGTGKTTSALRYSALKQLPFYSVSSNVGAEPSQLFGKYVPDGNGGFVWQDGGVTQLVRHGGVLLLNEINFLPAKVATVLMGLLDDRRQITLLDHKGEVINAHENLLVIADYNNGYRGTHQLNEAFADRFGIKLVFEYDTEIEKQFIKSKSLLELANKMRADSLSGTYETPISTRLLKNFVELVKLFNYDFAVDNFLNSFNDEERSSVKLLLEAYRYNVATELGVQVEQIVTDKGDELVNQ